MQQVLPQLAAAVDAVADPAAADGALLRRRHLRAAGGHRRRRAAAHLQRPRGPVRRPPRRRSWRWSRRSRTSRTGAGDAAEVGPCDVVVGLTASGRTPYVAGALDRARRRGAARADASRRTPGPSWADAADLLLAVDTGPEVITGSTRLKAGTAQKLVLNGFSTAVMVRLGRTWSNLMVDWWPPTPSSARPGHPHPLRGQRARGGLRAALERADGELKPALLSLLAGSGPARRRTPSRRCAASGPPRPLPRRQPGQPRTPRTPTNPHHPTSAHEQEHTMIGTTRRHLTALTVATPWWRSRRARPAPRGGAEPGGSDGGCHPR